MSEGDGNPTARDHGPMDQFSAHLDRGWDLVHRGDLAGAQRSAEKTLELDAESPEAYNLMGYVSAALGNHEAALEHYRQAIALDDSFVEAMLNAAEVLIHPLHDFGGAVDLIDEALEWAEGDDEVTDALLLKFDAFMHQGDRDAAHAVLRSLPEAEPSAPRLDFLVGRAHFEIGAFEPAKLRLERALGREPDNPDTHYYLGLVLDAQGEHDAATVAFLRCRELESHVLRPSWDMTQNQFERHLQKAIERLAAEQQKVLSDALIVVADLPGAEVVADGVDPRAAVLLDALGERDGEPCARRAFVYQRNVERMCRGPDTLEEDLAGLLQAEIEATFPALASEPAKESES